MSGKPQIAGVAATPATLRVRFRGACPAARLVELRPFQAYRADAGQPVVWRGAVGPGGVEIPRFDGQRDRLYSRFQLVDDATATPLGPPQWVTDLSSLPARRFAMPWPSSIKGVTCPVDLDDLVALGVKYVDTNVLLSQLIDWRSATPQATWDVDGHPVGIHLDYVRGLDAQIKRMTDAGINVTLIILNAVPTAPEPGNPLIHPRTDLAHAPNHLGAINCTSDAGVRCFRAAIEFLADRYSRPDGQHGWVSGYIIGNELQAHWQWHNMGRASADDVVADYARTLRIAWLAARRTHAAVRVYVSMEHHWTARIQQPDRSIRGDRFLEGLNALIRAQGNFPWHMAFHPYPENLFNPRFWDDADAWLDPATPKITFRNIEVLPILLRQERFLIDGKPRRIILSEQGLHCPDGPDGEALQAAAYAAAYHKLRHIPEIDAFILHRHVDYRGEGGLRLGLWTCKQDGPHPCVPDRKRPIWDVFRRADTPDWQQAFAFALPIVGIKTWDEMLPAKKLVEAAEPLDPASVVFDFVEHMHAAKVHNCLDWRPASVRRADGRRYRTLFQHPPTQGGDVGDATFDVALPAVGEGGKLVLRFATVLSGKSANGVGHTLLADGCVLWTHEQKVGKAIDHAVDLTPLAGRTIRLTLRVDSLGDGTYDWANWVRPAILREKK